MTAREQSREGIAFSWNKMKGEIMQRKRIKGSIWRPAFMALCACLLADMACGNTGGINQPPAAENDLLQF
jgi:hypothetical protein